MSLMDWLNMNLIVDIACAVFLIAITWKFSSLQKKVNILQEDISCLKSDLNGVIRNPQEARRKLLKNKQ